MGNATSCCPVCDSPTSVAIPGPQGDDGADGAPGISAFTVTTADFIVPAISANETISVGNSAWMTPGQNVFVEDAGVFEVVSLPNANQFVGTYLDYNGNTNSGNTITTGASVSPSGTQPVIANPLLIANGGTSASTKATAQVALGLGQSLTSDFDDALAYDITNAVSQITGMSVTVPAAGVYRIDACITVLYTGVTFAASRLLTIRVRNTTAPATHSEKTVGTNIHTTLSFPAIDYVLPPVTVTLAAADTIQLHCGLDTVESAGSSVVTDAFLVIQPIALS